MTTGSITYLWTKSDDTTIKLWECYECPQNGICPFEGDDPAIEHTKETGHTTAATYTHQREYTGLNTSESDPGKGLAVPVGVGWPAGDGYAR